MKFLSSLASRRISFRRHRKSALDDTEDERLKSAPPPDIENDNEAEELPCVGAFTEIPLPADDLAVTEDAKSSATIGSTMASTTLNEDENADFAVELSECTASLTPAPEATLDRSLFPTAVSSSAVNASTSSLGKSSRMNRSDQVIHSDSGKSRRDSFGAPTWCCDLSVASSSVPLNFLRSGENEHRSELWNAKWLQMEADIAAVEHVGVSKAQGRPMRHSLKASSPCRAGSCALVEYKWFSMQSELELLGSRALHETFLERRMADVATVH